MCEIDGWFNGRYSSGYIRKFDCMQVHKRRKKTRNLCSRIGDRKGERDGMIGTLLKSAPNRLKRERDPKLP